MTTTVINGVPVVHWRRDNEPGIPQNFGDELGPMIIEKLATGLPTGDGSTRLVALGSILHLAESGDVVWGSGVNAKLKSRLVRARSLNVRAVRGPRTRQMLRRLGFDVPEVYGDPGLLLPKLFPKTLSWTAIKSRPVTVIPNLNDLAGTDDPRVLSPLEDPWTVVRVIAESELVVGSSLHAIVIADALGVPARLVLSDHEHYLKYLDYLEGSGHRDKRIADSVQSAIDMGPADVPCYDVRRLLAAFPRDLWVRKEPPVVEVDGARTRRIRSEAWSDDALGLTTALAEARALAGSVEEASAQQLRVVQLHVVQPVRRIATDLPDKLLKKMSHALRRNRKHIMPVVADSPVDRAMVEALIERNYAFVRARCS